MGQALRTFARCRVSAIAVPETIRRVDYYEVRRDALVKNGDFWDAPALLARSGLQDYGGVMEYRPDSEVFAEASLKSRKGKPITLKHPPANLTAKTVRTFAMGAVGGDVRRSEQYRDHVAATLHMWAEELLDAVNDGVIQMSSGFTIDPDRTPGIHDGIPYRLIHRNIIVNHEAVVPEGRAGTARLLLDSDDSQVVTDFAPLLAERRRPSRPVVVDLGSWVRRDAADLAHSRPTSRTHEDKTMKLTIKIDGKDVPIEVPDVAKHEQVAEAVAKAHADAAEAKRKQDYKEYVEVDLGGTKHMVPKVVADQLAPPKRDEADEKKRRDEERAKEQAKLDALEERGDVLATIRAVKGVTYTGRDDHGKPLTADAMRLELIGSVLGKKKRDAIDALPEAKRAGAIEARYSDALEAVASKESAGEAVLRFVRETKSDAGERTEKDAAEKKLAEDRRKHDAEAALPASLRKQLTNSKAS
jgi:hypothetical protein